MTYLLYKHPELNFNNNNKRKVCYEIIYCGQHQINPNLTAIGALQGNYKRKVIK